jgi:hypothetical protein
MTPDQRAQSPFFALVERDLQLRHAPFDKSELVEFMRNVWPLIEPGNLPEVWATAFLQATAHRHPA